MAKIDISFLKEMGLTEEDYVWEQYSSGDIVIQQGYPADHIRLILSGTVNMSVDSSNGNIYIIRYSLGNTILGNIELLTNDATYINGAVAVTDLKIASITRQRASALLEENQRFFRYIAEDLAFKMRRTTGDILAAQTRTAEERLCFYLLEMTYGDVYLLPLTTAANATGVTYRHTWRMMKKLCDDGILSKEEKGYRILDRKMLRERAWKSG